MIYTKILIAVDSSEYALTAAKKGLELAQQLNATAALIFVIDLARTIHSADTGILPEEGLAILKKEVQQTLSQLITIYNGGKDLVKFMPEGRPIDDIIKTSETWGADLIVMGTHGRTGLMHLLMGSVAEQVLRHSKIPVMIVPSK